MIAKVICASRPRRSSRCGKTISRKRSGAFSRVTREPRAQHARASRNFVLLSSVVRGQAFHIGDHVMAKQQRSAKKGGGSSKGSAKKGSGSKKSAASSRGSGAKSAKGRGSSARNSSAKSSNARASTAKKAGG